MPDLTCFQRPRPPNTGNASAHAPPLLPTGSTPAQPASATMVASARLTNSTCHAKLRCSGASDTDALALDVSCSGSSDVAVLRQSPMDQTVLQYVKQGQHAPAVVR